MFRMGYQQVRAEYYSKKTNFAAILLDVANKQGEPKVWTDMYTQAQNLSKEVLAVMPDDESAKANLKGATKSLQFRTEQVFQKSAELSIKLPHV